MILPAIQKYIAKLLSEKSDLPLSSIEFHTVGGGSINNTYHVTGDHNINLFLKINSNSKYPKLFQKEKNGLEFIANQKVIRIPGVVNCAELDGYQILLLEWIEGGLKTEKFWKQFGERLAALHQVTNSNFGFEEDNYMGALPQLNHQQQNWINFFMQCRLQPQIKIAKESHLLNTKHLNAFEDLYPKLENIFNGENPSMLHGDLWSGNFMCDENSAPVLIDPAVYFGHRSIDLAMTTLFGGFDKIFYESYDYHFPFPENYSEQWEICNLYPLLIHLNLFGIGYLDQIQNTLKKFT